MADNGFVMAADNRGEYFGAMKELYDDISAGRLRQFEHMLYSNAFLELGKYELLFMALGILLVLILLLFVFLFVFLLDALDHSFSKEGFFQEIWALATIMKRLNRR